MKKNPISWEFIDGKGGCMRFPLTTGWMRFMDLSQNIHVSIRLRSYCCCCRQFYKKKRNSFKRVAVRRVPTRNVRENVKNKAIRREKRLMDSLQVVAKLNWWLSADLMFSPMQIDGAKVSFDFRCNVTNWCGSSDKCDVICLGRRAFVWWVTFTYWYEHIHASTPLMIEGGKHWVNYAYNVLVEMSRVAWNEFDTATILRGNLFASTPATANSSWYRRAWKVTKSCFGNHAPKTRHFCEPIEQRKCRDILTSANTPISLCSASFTSHVSYYIFRTTCDCDGWLHLIVSIFEYLIFGRK